MLLIDVVLHVVAAAAAAVAVVAELAVVADAHTVVEQ